MSAWGHSSWSTSRVFLPDSVEMLQAAMAGEHRRGVIARGYARSYGDQCQNDGGDVIDTTNFAGITTFDAATGIMQCESGASYADVTKRALAAGWLPAACPGTAFVSMGGAIANDVHGKNHLHAGTFTDHVTWFDLLLPSGVVQRVSRESDASLFRATTGGMGLTGVILSLEMQLKRCPFNSVTRTQSRIPNLDAFLETLPAASANNEYAVGWIDALQGGGSLGRGVLEVANSAAVNESPPSRRLTFPVSLPSWMLNRVSVGAFNEAYFRRIPSAGRTRCIHLEPFLYPLDAIRNWNRMYGTNGVYQFQCALPHATSRSGLMEIMEMATRSDDASFLAVIKCMGSHGHGLLSFSLPGFSLALDFPRRPATLALIRRMHEIVVKYDGRIYLAKDAILSAPDFESMYVGAEAFRGVLQQLDPGGVMQSDMARRLLLR